jgi:hypothetical protein
MGFAKPDPADENDIAFILYELEVKKILDLSPVDFFGPRPVELIQGFDHRKPGRTDAALDGAIPAHVGFRPHQFGEKMQVAPLLLSRCVRADLMVFPDVWKLQI